ncbi:MAG: ATP-binding protein [Solirubrobacteraceae bacterium]
MNEILNSRAEQLAATAEDLSCFSGLKVIHLRRAITETLARIGHNGLFDQYTKHDISHIDRMLASLDWLVPTTTWDLLTPTDALLHVLSIYFHDLGMLVTKSEYRERDASGWRDYVDTLYAGEAGEDYHAKVSALGPDGADRFLYQEYVREHHGERIRAWISGSVPARLGKADDAVSEVSRLLAPLPPLFREDLGLICESHHRHDLGDVVRYPVSRPYGLTDAETGNVQYAALLLRTADLLHITSDRTPSVTFRLIAPTDPISQQEWAKQMAVTAVRSKAGLDADGNVDPDAPRDTIAIFAQFSDENSFFGLTEYLTYARRELQQTFDWAAEAVRRHGSVYEFPWRHIDDSQVLTTGFLRDSFEFTLDTKRVLDLLTGHTLYNNTAVVVRELVQNSLDAIRVQRIDKHREGSESVRVQWDSVERRLTVTDNGTGMTQDVIERHLLRVGSSRYQDPEFQRRYPNFSPISRFGIGVLSTFMVADAVTVATVHPDEPQGRQLSLRSVHGRYLISLFDKDDPQGVAIGPHGTSVILDLRPSARLGDVREILEHWVVVPGCKVTLTIDNDKEIPVGADTIADALRSQLESDGVTLSLDDDTLRDGDIHVKEESRDGLNLAFAMRWSSHFKEWSLVPIRERSAPSSDNPTRLGTCIEGIRVETGTPGYRELSFYAMANATGPSAPRTDVARAGLEQTSERIDLLRDLYRRYTSFIASEVAALRDRGFSLTWSAQEARILSSSLSSKPALESQLLHAAVSEIPSVVVDDGDKRELVTPARVGAMPMFWTVESNFFRSAEALLRETLSSASVTALTEALGVTSALPDGPLVTSVLGYSSPLMRNREVSRIVLRPADRRVDLAWEEAHDPARWLHLGPDTVQLRRLEQRLTGRIDRMITRRTHATTLLGRVGNVQVEGRSNESVIKSSGVILLLPGLALTEFLITTLASLGDSDPEVKGETQYFLSQCVDAICRFPTDGRTLDPAEGRELFSRVRRNVGLEDGDTSLISGLADVVAAEPIRVFDAWAWDRGTNTSD